MKIPPSNSVPARPAPETSRAAARRGPTQGAAPPAADDGPEVTESGNAAVERDFASVLEEVSRPEKRRDDDAGEGDRSESRKSERAEREGEARRREERGDSKGGGEADSRGGGFDQRAGVREAAGVGDSTSARAILHIADLERIVSAVRTQLVAGGRHEVTVELRRSVLEGLRVKLSAGADGRVTAEFIAASERVRSQLDARAPELAEILRSRGINLASLQTSVGAGGGSAGGSGAQADNNSPQSIRGAGDAPPAARPAVADEGSAAEAGGDDATTYRA